jgi:hypothetical protein
LNNWQRLGESTSFPLSALSSVTWAGYHSLFGSRWDITFSAWQQRSKLLSLPTSGSQKTWRVFHQVMAVLSLNNLSNCTHCCVETLIIFSVLPLDATLAKN